MKTAIPVLLSFLAAAGLAQESRFSDPVTLHDYHPFREAESADWDSRQADIRDRILVASGLMPFPERTPLNAKRFGAVERDGFRVERVFFESFPGHYVTGSLFTPTGESESVGLVEGKRPAVLCPHGHWQNGRFYDLLERGGEPAVRQEIAKGAERFETAARNPIVSRCVQLARMGCVVLAYDMLGYADSIQFAEHRRGPREEMNSNELGKWGFVSPQATLRLQTNFGLQTWNSVRALDYLAGLAGVDPNRLLVTGASGGATQTMILAAIDERVDASFPAVMVSTAMQGGCTCENTHYLRIGQGNMDIGAAIAPKPLGLTAADDWTIELETKGHPDLVSLYERLKAPKNYEAHFDIHFPHNYNHVSRAHLYQFVNRHFGLGLENPVLERDYEYLGRDDLSVWSDPAMKPEGFVVGDEHERDVNRAWAEDAERGWKRAVAGEGQADWVRRGWEIILRPEAAPADAVFELAEKQKQGGNVVLHGLIRNGTDAISSTMHYPEEWNGEVVIRLSNQGRNLPVNPEGAAVLCLDLYGQNDEKAANSAMTYSGNKDVPPDSWQRSPVYYYGYNDSVFVRRVRDVVTAVRMARQHPDWEVKGITVEGEGPLAAVALAAKFIAGDDVDKCGADPGDFDFSQLSDVWDDYMVPGAVKFGGIEGLRSITD